MLSFNVCNRTIATKTANKDKCLPDAELSYELEYRW